MWPSTSSPPRIVTTRHVRRAERPPLLAWARQSSGVPLATSIRCSIPIVVRIAPGLLGPAAEALHRRRPAALERPLREEAVGEPGRPPDRGLGRSADPDRDRPLNRQRVDPGGGDAVPAALEVDDRLGPEPAQHLDLLLERRPRFAEVLAERLELDVVPAEADAEPEPPAGEQVDLGGLLGDERGLPLGQDEHAGDELEPGATAAR